MKKKYIKNVNIVFSILFLLFPCICVADIIESDTILSILDYDLTPNTVVICDIDNTLAHPIESIGSDEWFCHNVNTKILEGHDYITSVYYTLPITFYAQFNLPLELLEAVSPQLIQDLIAQGIPVMALSTRSLFIAERTIEQLNYIGISFFMPTIVPHDYVLAMKHPCFYKEGILFCSDNDKGEALIKFFDHMNFHPEAVIFIDDKLKYLLSVEKAVEKRGIPFHGIRYSGCDERVKNFDPIEAEMQYRKLKEKNKNIFTKTFISNPIINNELNKIIHQPIRMHLMAYLITYGSCNYTQLKNQFALSDGHMTTHMKALLEHQYIEMKKTFVNNKPCTTYYVTDKGRQEFVQYMQQLKKIIETNAL